MRIFTFLFICLWTAGFIVGCAKARFTTFENTDTTTPPTQPTTPPPTTCEDNNSCPTIQGFQFHQDSFTAPGGDTKVDALFVVDNSPSMSIEQTKLGDGFNGFINVLNQFNFNYQIGFVTTDMSGTGPTKDGKLLKIQGTNTYLLKWSDVNQRPRHQDLFKATVTRSEVGSGDERGIYAAIKALQRNEHGFLRSDADLAIIIISDEDERSRGRDSLRLESGKDYPSDLIKVATQIKGSKAFTAHALVIKNGDKGCLKQQQAQGSDATPYYGKMYQELATRRNGKTGSLCEADYTDQLAEVSRKLIRRTESVTMKCVPDINRDKGRDVQVILPQSYINEGGRATVNGSKIVFNPEIIQGTVIEYSYWCKTS